MVAPQILILLVRVRILPGELYYIWEYSMPEKRLYKTVYDRKIAGVCGGIAKYFDIDSTLIRLLWIIFACLGGSGVIAYIICMIIMPQDY